MEIIKRNGEKWAVDSFEYKGKKIDTALSLEITPELKAEGQINDLFRLVAVLRKYYKLKPEEPLIISKTRGGKEKLKIENYGKNKTT